MLARGFDVTANDLSPVLLERLRAAVPRPIPTIACDIIDIAAHVDGPFDGVVGFFVLHHLRDFEAIFRALVRVLRPGGRVAFCEPVAWNPLYYVQNRVHAGHALLGRAVAHLDAPGPAAAVDGGARDCSTWRRTRTGISRQP